MHKKIKILQREMTFLQFQTYLKTTNKYVAVSNVAELEEYSKGNYFKEHFKTCWVDEDVSETLAYALFPDNEKGLVNKQVRLPVVLITSNDWLNQLKTIKKHLDNLDKEDKSYELLKFLYEEVK